jgi:hypothetical protein
MRPLYTRDVKCPICHDPLALDSRRAWCIIDGRTELVPSFSRLKHDGDGLGISLWLGIGGRGVIFVK